jgi:hypothetical protein
MAVSSTRLRPKSDCSGKDQKQFTVNYRPVLSSERALQNKKLATVWKKFQVERKIGRWSQMGAWHQDWLTIGRKLTSSSTSIINRSHWIVKYDRVYGYSIQAYVTLLIVLLVNFLWFSLWQCWICLFLLERQCTACPSPIAIVRGMDFLEVVCWYVGGGLCLCCFPLFTTFIALNTELRVSVIVWFICSGTYNRY